MPPATARLEASELLDVIRNYLSDDLGAAADAAGSNAEMTDRVLGLYPAHEQADFLLAYSAMRTHGPDGPVA